MEFGAHLPIVDFGDGSLTLDELQAYTATADRLGYATLAANDHLVWRRPWLDGPTALVAVLGHVGAMTLATSISLVTIRHPVVTAKWLTALAHLSGARVVAGLGPGSSSVDYAAVGIPFDERWARFDEAFVVVRELVRGRDAPSEGFYDVAGLLLEPQPARQPEVWFGSWGSDQRLKALAAVADGWMASGYHTTPTRFADARARLDAHLIACGRDPAGLPDMIATMWLCVTATQREADHMLRDVLAPALGTEPDALATQVPIGSPEHCVGLLQAYADAGAQQILLWPVSDPIEQLHRFDELVRPHITP